MRNLIFIITIAFIYFFSSCQKCKNIDFCSQPASAAEYFGAYTEGAYWIYYNHSSTKMDSVYLTNYEIKRERERIADCIEWDTKTFMLQSEFLSNKIIEVDISNGGYCDRSFSSFLMRSNYEICIGHLNESSLPNECGVKREIEIIKVFKLNDSLNFKDVVKYDNRYWFAPEIGLIKYITQNNIDTFYLHEHKKF